MCDPGGGRNTVNGTVYNPPGTTAVSLCVGGRHDPVLVLPLLDGGSNTGVVV